MEGGLWKPSAETLPPSPGRARAEFLLRARILVVLFLFFLLLRNVLSWSRWEAGPKPDPRESWKPLRLSPFDSEALQLLPGVGPRRAQAIGRWARREGSEGWVGVRRESHPQGIGGPRWEALRAYLDLSHLVRKEARDPPKSSRE